MPWKPRPAGPGEINYAWIDPFTFLHFGIGMLYGFLGAGPWLSFGLAVLWEIVENPLKVYCRFLFPEPTADSLRNQIGDVLALMLGWVSVYLAR